MSEESGEEGDKYINFPPTFLIDFSTYFPIYSGSQKSEVCPMPYALCPMPYGQCPRTPHVTEKGYIYYNFPSLHKPLSLVSGLVFGG